MRLNLDFVAAAGTHFGPVQTIDELLARVCNDLNIQMSNAPSVVLNRSVISAHLVELQQAGQVTQAVKDNRLLFQAT